MPIEHRAEVAGVGIGAYLAGIAFRIYNEYIAELQERSAGHFYGAGLINWWDPTEPAAP